jgi:hypothetical protein
VFGGLGLLLIIAIGGRVRADRALAKANEVAQLGTPGEVAARAQQMVSVWAGQPAVVIEVERERRYWRAVAMAGTDCYELAVSERVSAHPGLVPCPPVAAAGSADDALTGTDPRRVVVAGFLGAWLTGDPTADRYLADSRPAFAPLPERATDVKVTGFYGDDAPSDPGARSIVTASAQVTLPGRTESLAWTFALVHGDSRWSIDQMAGGEIPTGDSADLTRGRTTAETTQQGD